MESKMLNSGEAQFRVKHGHREVELANASSILIYLLKKPRQLKISRAQLSTLQAILKQCACLARSLRSLARDSLKCTLWEASPNISLFAPPLSCSLDSFHSRLYTKLTELSNQLSFRKIYIGATLWHRSFCQAFRGTNKQLYIPAFLMVSRPLGGRLRSRNNRLLGCCHPLLYIQCRRNSRVIPNSICWSQT